MTLFAALDDLLRNRNTNRPFLLFFGAILCYAAYGVAAGFFQGGAQIGVALIKAPLILLGSLALCIPSLYVFTALSGTQLDARGFAKALAGFAGIAGLILIALMPVIWLFSVSTISLEFVVWLHIFAWLIALAFGRRFLVGAFGAAGRAAGLWLVLMLLVSLQMTTYLRPVLWRDAGQPLFAREKMSFFSHLGEVVDWKPKTAALTSPAGATSKAVEGRR
jgi:hypothetical protein